MAQRRGRTQFLITRIAVDKIRDGQESLGWTDEELAKAIPGKITKQAVGQILSDKAIAIGKRSPHLADMLRAVKKPAFYAWDLTPAQLALFEALERAKGEFRAEELEGLAMEAAQIIDGKVALREKERSPKK